MAIKGWANNAPGKHNYSGGGIRGLMLYVSPKGKSTWVLKLKIHGKSTTRKLGEASAMCNADTARRLAGELIERNKAGELTRRDERAAGQSTYKLGGAMTAFTMEMRKQGLWSREYTAKVQRRIQLHLSPLLDRRLDALTRPEIVRHLESIKSTHISSKIYSWVRECLETNVDRGLLPYCVLGRKPRTLTVQKKNSTPHKSYGLDLPKLRALYSAIVNCDSGDSAKLAGRFVLLSGLRLGEILVLRSEYCFEDKIVIPRSVMKMSDHWRGDYILPLSSEAKIVIAAAKEIAVDGWLFAGARSGKPLTHEAVEKMFRKLTNREAVPHGTRTSLRSWALEDGVSEIVANSLIDHATSTGADASYDRTQFVEQRRKILEKWADVLT